MRVLDFALALQSFEIDPAAAECGAVASNQPQVTAV